MARRIKIDSPIDLQEQRRLAERTALFEMLADAKIAKDAAIERYDELASQVRDLLPATGKYTEGRVQVSIQPNRVWNKDKALENFGDNICSMQVDLAKARKFLTGDEFDSLYVSGPNKVIVKVLD